MYKFLLSWLWVIFSVFLTSLFAYAENGYPELVTAVEIKSTTDGAIQNALFYDPKSEHAVPLLVALHTWSSDWMNTHNVPLAKGVLKEDGPSFILTSGVQIRGPRPVVQILLSLISSMQ